jgi:hypothetical protein
MALRRDQNNSLKLISESGHPYREVAKENERERIEGEAGERSGDADAVHSRSLLLAELDKPRSISKSAFHRRTMM